MRPWMEKWGSMLLIFFCALVILFSALYTRQDDLKRLRAQSADAGQNETLGTLAHYCPPADTPPVKPFAGAYRTDGGLWRLDPYVCYDLSSGQSVYACCAGTVCRADSAQITLQAENGLVFTLRGSFVPAVVRGAFVAAGQRIARTAGSGTLSLALSLDGHYLDPLSLF